MSKPKISIIIPTRKVNDFIRKGIPYHLRQNFKDFEIIIVCESWKKERFPKTRFVKVNKIPPAEKRNIGVKEARGEIIAFIDDDAYPEKNWLRNALEEFEDKKVVGVGGPSFVPPDSTFFQKVSNEVYRLSSKKTGLRYDNAPRQEVEDWATCNLFVRRRNFLSIGGFDATKWGGEDTQLCYELKKNGNKIMYNPELRVYHYPRRNLKAHLRQTLFWSMWRGYLMKKYPRDSIRLTFFMPLLLVLWLFFGGITSLFWKTFGYLYIGIFFLYVLSLIFTGSKVKKLKLFFPVIFVTMLTQLIYGIGLLKGIIAFNEPTKVTFNPAEIKKDHKDKS